MLTNTSIWWYIIWLWQQVLVHIKISVVAITFCTWSIKLVILFLCILILLFVPERREYEKQEWQQRTKTKEDQNITTTTETSKSTFIKLVWCTPPASSCEHTLFPVCLQAESNLLFYNWVSEAYHLCPSCAFYNGSHVTHKNTVSARTHLSFGYACIFVIVFFSVD